jgi:hypothetical protein
MILVDTCNVDSKKYPQSWNIFFVWLEALLRPGQTVAQGQRWQVATVVQIMQRISPSSQPPWQVDPVPWQEIHRDPGTPLLMTRSRSVWFIPLRTMKYRLKGSHFETVEEIQKVTTPISTSRRNLWKCFDSWKQCWNLCVDAGGNCCSPEWNLIKCCLWVQSCHLFNYEIFNKLRRMRRKCKRR